MSTCTDYQPNSDGRPHQTADDRRQTAAIMSPARKQPDTSTYAGRFAVHIRELRLKKGLSVEELAERSGIPPTSIYNWESGNHSGTTAEISGRIGIKRYWEDFSQRIIPQSGNAPLDFIPQIGNVSVATSGVCVFAQYNRQKNTSQFPILDVAVKVGTDSLFVNGRGGTVC